MEFIYGQLSANGALQGMTNDSIPITMKIDKLPAEGYYLNKLYTD